MRVCSVFGEISDKLHKCFVLWSYDLIKLCMHMWEDAVSCMHLLVYSLAWKLGEVLGKQKVTHTKYVIAAGWEEAS